MNGRENALRDFTLSPTSKMAPGPALRREDSNEVLSAALMNNAVEIAQAGERGCYPAGFLGFQTHKRPHLVLDFVRNNAEATYNSRTKMRLVRRNVAFWTSWTLETTEVDTRAPRGWFHSQGRLAIE